MAEHDPLARVCRTAVGHERFLPALFVALLPDKAHSISANGNGKGNIDLGMMAAIEAIDCGEGSIVGYTLTVSLPDGPVVATLDPSNKYQERQLMVLQAVQRRKDHQIRQQASNRGSPKA